MKKLIVVIILILNCILIFNCSEKEKPTRRRTRIGRSFIQKLFPTGIAEDETYGYTKKNPIKVGLGPSSRGPSYERIYLRFLKGPNGEHVFFRRMGSCCPFKTPNGYNGIGLLDIYHVMYKTLNNEIKRKVLYLNMYDYEPTKAPKGFTF